MIVRTVVRGRKLKKLSAWRCGRASFFVETPEFRSWRDNDSELVAQILFCAGKTFIKYDFEDLKILSKCVIASNLTGKISSLAIDNLSGIPVSDPARANIGVSYIYNDLSESEISRPGG